LYIHYRYSFFSIRIRFLKRFGTGTILQKFPDPVPDPAQNMYVLCLHTNDCKGLFMVIFQENLVYFNKPVPVKVNIINFHIFKIFCCKG
jgi:hypothetical protein